MTLTSFTLAKIEKDAFIAAVEDQKGVSDVFGDFTKEGPINALLGGSLFSTQLSNPTKIEGNCHSGDDHIFGKHLGFIADFKPHTEAGHYQGNDSTYANNRFMVEIYTVNMESAAHMTELLKIEMSATMGMGEETDELDQNMRKMRWKQIKSQAKGLLDLIGLNDTPLNSPGFYTSTFQLEFVPFEDKILAIRVRLPIDYFLSKTKIEDMMDHFGMYSNLQTAQMHVFRDLLETLYKFDQNGWFNGAWNDESFGIDFNGSSFAVRINSHMALIDDYRNKINANASILAEQEDPNFQGTVRNPDPKNLFSQTLPVYKLLVEFLELNGITLGNDEVVNEETGEENVAKVTLTKWKENVSSSTGLGIFREKSSQYLRFKKSFDENYSVARRLLVI